MNLFGAGFLVGRPAATAANPNPTPRKFGQLQEVSFDSTFTTKELMGANQHPLREFRGAAKTELKAKFAKISGRQFAEIFWGIAPASETTGTVTPVFGETATIPATPFQVTAANAGAAGVNFLEDFGPEYVSSGIPFKLVASGPTQGQYSVTAAGVYTFAAADTLAAIVLNYSYNVTASGFTFSVPNTVQAESPYFETILVNPQDGGFVRRIYRCSASKIAENFKQGDIMIPELDIKVYDPGSGIMWQDSYAAE